MKIISLWSGPRNVSTALMYSFAQRPDTEVIDEPLYAHYLKTSGADHPGRQEVLAGMESDGNSILEQLVSAERNKPILFIKNMAHHFIELSDQFLERMVNIFLIRSPFEMLPSLSKQIPTPILRDTGLDMQVFLFKEMKKQGQTPLVIDSSVLLQDPENILRQVCKQLNIAFYPDMLAWKAGPRSEDGIWAKYWYHNVHLSTGFVPYKKKDIKPGKTLLPILEECLPYYEFLYQQALTIHE